MIETQVKVLQLLLEMDKAEQRSLIYIAQDVARPHASLAAAPNSVTSTLLEPGGVP
jgi:hypothetical protein